MFWNVIKAYKMANNEFLKSKLSKYRHEKDKTSINENVSQNQLYHQQITMDKESQCILKKSDLSTQIDNLIVCEKAASDNLTAKATVDTENQTENQNSNLTVPKKFENEKSDPPKT